jgi:tetratricopeptide (TPR) repeat protein
MGATEVVPGHVVTLELKRRWTWRGDPYASGRMLAPRIDVPKLGLTPLPLRVFRPAHDLREDYEPFTDPDPYAPLWRRLTEKPRMSYDMDPIAWGALSGGEGDGGEEDLPVCDASDLIEAGDVEGARELLMDTLLRDLRCIDAHEHLGSIEFEHLPQRASQHYEIGVRIGDLSLPPGFDGVLIWGRIYNRPFLRCLHGLGLCHWRLGRAGEALALFERILALNPNDNQGIRFLREALLDGQTWEEFREEELAERR